MRKNISVLGSVVQVVAPCIAGLRSESAPALCAKQDLKGIVIGDAIAAELIDGSIVRVSTVEGAALLLHQRIHVDAVGIESRLVDIAQEKQMPCLAANIADLSDSLLSQRLLQIETVVEAMGSLEVLVDGKEPARVDRGSVDNARCGGIRAGRRE